jgi:hypothetical protein
MYAEGNKIKNTVNRATLLPIITCVLETRTEKKKIRQMLESNETKLLRKILGKT